jgi:hypothetical protein
VSLGQVFHQRTSVVFEDVGMVAMEGSDKKHARIVPLRLSGNTKLTQALIIHISVALQRHVPGAGRAAGDFTSVESNSSQGKLLPGFSSEEHRPWKRARQTTFSKEKTHENVQRETR